ncbi:LytR family transcriptional regulator [Soehngenia saccharolytica]|jgi:LCP family protein required for cell wall assembly|nr:LytR family transcriptional regulator [Soehngenia saccharolytica]
MKKQFITVFIVSLLAFASIYAVLANTIFDEEKVAAEDPLNPIDEEPIENDKNELVFLLLGVDAKDLDHAKGTRTDTIMLTRVNFDTGKISILSIPRDTRTMVNGKLDKINAAHAYGGVDMTLEAVSDLIGFDIDYYVLVDYQIVKEVVDAIGGVDIEVPFDMKYDDPTADPPLHINLEKGFQNLNGQEAHDFLRFRHNNNYTVGYPDGDVGRIKAQQYFMKELVKQTLTPKNIFKIPTLIKTYYNNVETNIPFNFVLKGATMVNKIDTNLMETATIPGEGEYIGDISYFIYDGEQMQELVNNMFGDYIVEPITVP